MTKYSGDVSFYEHGEGLYVNLTNRCPVACRFCAKQAWGWSFEGRDLLLKTEAPFEELRAGLRKRLLGSRSPRELIFCGTYRLEEMGQLSREAAALREDLPIRLNTIGLGDLIWGRDIVPELALFLDAVSVSLNTADPAQWLEMHRPAPAFRKSGFEVSRRFVARCVAAGLRTRVTAVELPGVDLESLRSYARSIGAEFLARPPLTN